MNSHYVPAPTGSETQLVLALAAEHPHHLYVVSQGGKLYFESRHQVMTAYVWYMLSVLRHRQNQLNRCWFLEAHEPSNNA